MICIALAMPVRLHLPLGPLFSLDFNFGVLAFQLLRGGELA
jgi:hypothetical protein